MNEIKVNLGLNLDLNLDLTFLKLFKILNLELS